MKEKKISDKWIKPLAVGLVLVLFGMTVLPAVSQSYGTSAIREGYGLSADYVEVDCAIEDPDPEEIEYDYFYQDLTQTIENINQGQPTTVHFFQTDMQLQLEVSELIPEGGKIYVGTENGTEEYPMEPVAYVGAVLDEGGEEAGLVIMDGWISGFAVMGDYIYWNEVVPTDTPLYQPYRSWRVERLREYNESLSDPDEQICEPPGAKRVHPGRMSNLNRLPTQGYDLRREPDPEPLHGTIAQTLFAHSDRDFFNLFWWCPWIGWSQWLCAWLRMLTDIVGVANIFRSDTSVIFSIGEVFIDDDGDCGLNSRDSQTLLDQFEDDMETNDDHLNANYHVAHLFTGKNLNGDTIGRGERPGHYSLSQQVSAGWFTTYHATTYQRIILESHEIGHNYNGVHNEAERRRHWWPFWPFFHWHYTIMWTPFQGNNMIPDFSDDNEDRIHTNAHNKPLAP